MKIDITPLLNIIDNQANDIESVNVKVGILNSRSPSRQGDPSKPRAAMKANRKGTLKRLALKRKINRKGWTLEQLAKHLDKERGLFSKFSKQTNYNRDAQLVAQQFANMWGRNDSVIFERQLENACQALIRNPIFERQYGGNSPQWSKIKTNNHYGIATSTLFENIKARVFYV